MWTPFLTRKMVAKKRMTLMSFMIRPNGLLPSRIHIRQQRNSERDANGVQLALSEMGSITITDIHQRALFGLILTGGEVKYVLKITRNILIKDINSCLNGKIGQVNSWIK